MSDIEITISIKDNIQCIVNKMKTIGEGNISDMPLDEVSLTTTQHLIDIFCMYMSEQVVGSLRQALKANKLCAPQINAAINNTILHLLNAEILSNKEKTWFTSIQPDKDVIRWEDDGYWTWFFQNVSFLLVVIAQMMRENLGHKTAKWMDPSLYDVYHIQILKNDKCEKSSRVVVPSNGVYFISKKAMRQKTVPTTDDPSTDTYNVNQPASEHNTFFSCDIETKVESNAENHIETEENSGHVVQNQSVLHEVISRSKKSAGSKRIRWSINRDLEIQRINDVISVAKRTKTFLMAQKKLHDDMLSLNLGLKPTYLDSVKSLGSKLQDNRMGTDVYAQ